MNRHKRINFRRSLSASWRDTWLLFRQFRWPVLAFFIAMLGGGLLYFFLSQYAGESIENILEAIYVVMALTFFQPVSEFPETWYLEIFYFLMPLIGIIILAQGVAEFSIMLFNRRARSKEWEKAVASTFSHHNILIGLGHLGFKVIQNLYSIGQEVVAIELNPDRDMISNVREMGIPVIQEDATQDRALEAAGIRKANTLILCTQNDSLNLKIALKARRLNPKLRIVLRIFDEDFAQALQDQFGFIAMSATGMAAPAFASAATGIDILQPFVVEGENLSLARVRISEKSRLIDMTVGQVEQGYDISIILLQNHNQLDLHPDGSVKISTNDLLAIVGGPQEIQHVAQANQDH